MEQENVQNVETTEVVSENTDTQTVEQNEGAFKVFKTQEEYQNAINSMMKSKLPKKEEMEEFKKWQESKKTEAEKQTELTKNNVDLTNRNALLEQKLLVSDSNVPKEYRDFVQFTVSQMEGDFEENLKDYLKNNPQYLQREEVTEVPSQDTGVPVTKNNQVADSGVTAILKQKHPELFN